MSDEKSKPPIIIDTTGMTTSLTREVTMAVNAPPMMIPTARSVTDPRLMNSLNSLNIFGSFCLIVLVKSAPFLRAASALAFRFVSLFIQGYYITPQKD